MQNYDYPLNPDWTTQEMIAVVELLSAVEAAYEDGIALATFQARYDAFKQIVTSIGEEKRLDKSFHQASGYSLYRAVQAMKQAQQSSNAKKMLKMPSERR